MKTDKISNSKEIIATTKKYISQIESQALFLEIFSFSYFNPDYPIKAAQLRALSIDLKQVIDSHEQQPREQQREFFLQRLGNILKQILSIWGMDMSLLNDDIVTKESSNPNFIKTPIAQSIEKQIAESIEKWKSKTNKTNQKLFKLPPVQTKLLYGDESDYQAFINQKPPEPNVLFLKYNPQNKRTVLYYRDNTSSTVHKLATHILTDNGKIVGYYGNTLLHNTVTTFPSNEKDLIDNLEDLLPQLNMTSEDSDQHTAPRQAFLSEKILKGLIGGLQPPKQCKLTAENINNFSWVFKTRMRTEEEMKKLLETPPAKLSESSYSIFRIRTSEDIVQNLDKTFSKKP